MDLQDLEPYVQEEWRDVPTSANHQVSNLGRVRSSFEWTPEFLKGWTDVKGYRRVRVGGVSTTVHRLVLLAFVGPCPEGMETRHLNGVRDDNRLENLAYGTHLENIADVLRHGNHTQKNKTHCASGHEYDEANTRVTDGKRHCRKCVRAAGRRYYQRKKEGAA